MAAPPLVFPRPWLLGTTMATMATTTIGAVATLGWDPATATGPWTLVAFAVAAVGLLQLVLAVRWFLDAHRFATSDPDRPGRYESIWAGLGWFIPIAWWIIPRGVIRDIWRGTLNRDDEPQWITQWWAAFLAWWGFSLVGGLLGPSAVADAASLLAAAAYVIAGLFFIRYVKVISVEQDRLAPTAPTTAIGEPATPSES